MGLKTTSQEVITRFAGRSVTATAALEKWRDARPEVSEVVETHRSAVLYSVTPDQVEAVCRRTEHALGEVKKSEADKVKVIRDWNPSFAFTHILYRSVEVIGELPTYGEFRSFCREDPVACEALWEPAKAEIRSVVSRSDHPRSRVEGAMRWRIGNAYYSFLKELYVLAVLRQSGIDARAHPLADALFRVDCWVENTNVILYVKNSRYRSGVQGRKNSAERMLGDANPEFDFHVIELETRRKFGVVHLPELQRVAEAAARLR